MLSKSIINKIIITFGIFPAITFFLLQGCGSIDSYHQIKEDPRKNQLYPFHLKEPTKNKKTFHYSFKQVWNASIMLLNEKKELYKKEGFDSRIFSDENSGFLCLTTVLDFKNMTSFISNMLFLKSIDKNNTKLYNKKIYYRYLSVSDGSLSGGGYFPLTNDFNEFDNYFEELNTIRE